MRSPPALAEGPGTRTQLGERQRTAVLFTSSYCMGGIEVHLIDLARGLVRRGWRVALICSMLDDIEPLRQEMGRTGVNVHAVPNARGPLQLVRRAWRLGKVLHSYPDCVVHLHCQGESGGMLITFLSRLVGSAAVVRTLHNPPVPPISRRHRAQVRISNRLLDSVVCVSPETERSHLLEYSWNPGKLVTIPNGVDLDRFSRVPSDTIRSQLGISPHEQVVGTVARLQEARKGISEFIDMAAEVARRRPNARFIVVGDGPLRPALELQAAQLGLRDRIVFTGYRRDVPSLLSVMDVAVFPSTYEAAQYVMLEAMAVAVPVVTTPAGLASELVDPGSTGMLVPVGDIAAMCNAVEQLLVNPDMARRMGEAARALVVRGYSTDVMVDAMAALYRRLTDTSVLRGRGLAEPDFGRSAREPNL